MWGGGPIRSRWSPPRSRPRKNVKAINPRSAQAHIGRPESVSQEGSDRPSSQDWTSAPARFGASGISLDLLLVVVFH